MTSDLRMRVVEAPEMLYDIDGMPSSVRRDLAATPWKAIRFALDEGYEWLLDDVGVHWVDYEESRGWYRRDELHGWIADTKPNHMRPWNADEDDTDSEWGEDAWYWCNADHPDAVEYWELPWA